LGRRGRRIAVLGDMLELGTGAAEFHGQLIEPIASQAIDLVFCAGPLMRALWERLPPERRGGYAETSAALEAEVLATVRGGDVIMVKGSLGSRMGPIVQALARRFPRQEAAAPAAAQG
jgi:UDP-N-acetylmuramoyl-tripeptide--D-alanyl-D-alanine ligase